MVDADGRILAQADRQPLNSLAATSVWQPGDVIRDPYAISLPPDLPLDTAVRVGLYLRETGARWPYPHLQDAGTGDDGVMWANALERSRQDAAANALTQPEN